jgi:hypothetical protein
MLFHFQIRGEHGWEALGSGVSTTTDALAGAIDDLRSLHGGTLPRGSYEYVEAQGTDPRFGSFRLGEDGELLG